MSLDDLLKGLSAFNQGITQYATTKAVNDANEQLQALNAQEMDRNAKFQAQSQIGQDLAMQLGAVGANPALIQEMSSQAGPSMGAQYAAEQSKQLQESSQSAAKALEVQRFGHEKEIEQMKLDAQKDLYANKQKKELGAFMTVYQKEFNRLTQKASEAATMASTVKDIIKSGNPVGDNTVGLFMAKLVQGGSQLSDSEREIFQGSPALANKAKSIAQRFTTGKTLTAQDRVFMSDLAQKFADANKNKIDTTQNMLTKQAAARANAQGYDFSQNEIAGWFGRGGGGGTSAPSGLTPEQEARRQELLKKAGQAK